ncbi:MAG: hypothetical protein OEV86_13950 [Candidatus Krumholzibacteria bacterium]|nr:hypothetical protein [Candidatus Krumholzibacteria bacterium]
MNDENTPVGAAGHNHPINTASGNYQWPNVTVTMSPVTFSTTEWPPGGARLPLAVEVPEVEDEPVEEYPEDDMDIMWEGILGFEGVPTSDGRYLIPGGITERAMPLSLLAQFATEDGHEGAEVCGRIDRVWRMAMPTVGPRAVAIMGAGVFSKNGCGPKAAAMVDEMTLRGVSMDMAAVTTTPVDATTLEEIPLDDVSAEQVMNGQVLIGMRGEIGAATLCAVPAFGGANISVIAADHVMVASAGTITVTREKALTASAAGLAPTEPPHNWFFLPEANQLTPLTVTDEGQVFGHLAPNDLCHTGLPNSCRLSPRSRSDYAYFHVGEIRCEDGQRVPVGRIVVDDTGGHAPLSASVQQAQKHYDKPAKVGAFVRASEGKHGIWLSGCVRSDAPATLVRDLMANPPSGDWRDINGNLELVAACSVPVPGFPVPRAEYAMVASAGGDEQVTALIVENAVREPLSKSDQRRIGVLSRKVREVLA